jgi:hypothetical protein
MYIPNKIKVGYQDRNDTFTKKLAFVIYYDETGKLRQERSWNNWRDNKIESNEYENVPISDFVLNKKAGGYGQRSTYCRVYDPRGFEIEISIENLLLILDYCSSIKGKGIEGELIYAWNDKKVELLPIDSQEYKDYKKASELVENNEPLKMSQLKEGYVYMDKEEKEYTYMGKHMHYCYDGKPTTKKHFFIKGKYVDHYSSTKKFIKELRVDSDYNKKIDILENSTDYSPIERTQYDLVNAEFIRNKTDSIYTKSGRHAYIHEKFIGGICTYEHKEYPSIEELLKSHTFYKQTIYLKNGRIKKR